MTTAQKWLLGCGIGCGVLILLSLILVGVGIAHFRGFASDIQESEEAQERLDAELGGLDTYTPPLDGTVPPDRLEIFLAVRAVLQPSHVTMTEHLSEFPLAAEDRVHLGAMQQLNVAKGMAGFLRDLGGYQKLRNETLLEHGMGLGEYYYIHTLVYHWWLGHDPIDGPELLYGLEHHDGVNIQFFDDDSNFGKGGSRRRYHATVCRMLGRQLEAVQAADPEAVPEGWADALAAELEALESDRYRSPWEDGLPEHLTAGLEPRREEIDATYCPVTNIFDMHDAEGGPPPQE
jgi:hypothetical protein